MMSNSKPTMSELDRHLKNVIKWKRFALHLPGIDQPMIDTIEMSKCDGNDEEKIALYKKWLRVCTNPTWEDVINALEIVDENRIAKELKETFSTSQRLMKKEMFDFSKSGGYSLEIFIDSPPIKVICPICKLVERDPFLMGCCGDLTMCKICLEHCDKCPKCHEIPCRSVLNTVHNRIIMKLLVRCIKKGCQWKGELANLESHIFSDCGHEVVKSDVVNHTAQHPNELPHRESTVDATKHCEKWQKPQGKKGPPLVKPKPRGIVFNQPRIDEISDSTIKLSWEKPKMIPPFKSIEYSVSFCTTDDVDTWIDYEKSTKTESIEVEGLHLHETYCFKIKIFDQTANELVESKPSRPVKLEKTLPDPPGKPIAIDISETSITIEWAAPKNAVRKKVKVYLVLYSLKDHEKWSILRTTRTIATITNLVPNTCYLFKVQAKLESEESQVSEISRVQTKNLEIPDPPQCKLVGNDRIELVWKAPLDNEQFVEKYELFTYKSSESASIRQIWCKKNCYAVENLSPDTKYYFTVRAHCTNNCTSEFSKQSEVISTPKPLPYILQKPIATDVTSTSVSLQWCPNDQKAVLKYMILYTSNKKSDCRTVKTSDNTPKYIISDLEPNTEYIFRIRAESHAYEEFGDESEPSDVIRTKPILCSSSSPGKPEVVSRTCNSIELKWGSPAENSSIVKYYYIQYITPDMYRHGGAIQWCNVHDQLYETHTTVKNLDADVDYCFRVTAVFGDDSLVSEPSDWIKTKFSPPNPPGKPFATAVTQSSVHLKWSRSQPLPHQLYQIVYNVYHIQKNNDATLKCGMIHAEEAVVRDLNPTTTYFFQIEAVNPDGGMKMGPISDAILTNKEAPSPGKPCVLLVTHNTVKLAWEKSVTKKSELSHYLVHYKHPEDKHWEQRQTNADETNIEICGLQHSVQYIFRVVACSKEGKWGSVSEISEPVVLKCALPSAPGKPVGKPHSANRGTINLKWTKPQTHYENIKYYKISYYEDGENYSDRKSLVTNGVVELVQINGLSGKGYYFDVQAVTDSGETSEASVLSDLITVERLAERFLSQCSKTDETNVPTFLLPTKVAYVDNNYMLNKLEIQLSSKIKRNRKQYSHPSHKVLMLVGTTGSGKTTLINGIVNYIMGVEFDDHFRYKLVHGTSAQTESVMKWITAYTIYHEPGFPLPFSLTIVDTSSFHNAESIECSKKQLKHFLSTKGVPHIDGIGFVCQAGSVSLTPTQKYILDSILSMFSNDIKSSIFVLCTFCDGRQDPTVIKAVQKSANIPAANFFKFNNSALYASKKNPMTKTFWDIGISSFMKLFNEFAKTKPLSLSEEVAISPSSVIDPSIPWKPCILHATHNKVKLAWKKSPHVSELSHYLVHYKHPDGKHWEQIQTKGNETNIEVCGLQHSVQYIFRVVACNMEGEWSYMSENSEPVVLKYAFILPSAPGKPVGKLHPGNCGMYTINLKWTKPHINYENVKCYKISYYEDGQDSSERKSVTTDSVVELIQLKGISGKGYYFDVKAVTDSGETSEASFLSDLISDEGLAEKVLPQCTKIDDTNIPVFLLPTKNIYVNDQLMLKKFDIKLTKTQSHCPTKVLMLVGDTGSGKSTLINGMVNYIMRVEFGNHHFRYKLVHNNLSSQSESVTKWITAYTIYHDPGFQLPFSLTIIDTPSFGNTEGIVRDKFTKEQIKHFFNMKEGISHIDGIGFVCQAGSVRLTPTQRYIFDSVFAMFGNDIKDNIFVFCTFCDGEEPAVIKAVAEANLPINNFFKFNNSALYASNKNPITELFWNISITSFRKFFEKFERTMPVSLTLTKEVWQQQENLEIIQVGVQKQMTTVMHLINQLKTEIEIFEKNKAAIVENKGFAFEVKEGTVNNEKFTTNCLKCNTTAETAVNENLSIEKIIESLKNKIDDELEVVLTLIQKANECTKRLDEIAFHPNHDQCSDVEYIQLLINAEFLEKRIGYQERVKYYQILQERLVNVKEIKAKAVQGDRRWWEMFF